MLWRMSAASGLLFAALLAAAYVLGGPMPPAGTPPDRLVAFVSAHSQTQEWSWFLTSGPALLTGPSFLGALASKLWESDPAARYLTAAAFANALVAGALLAAAGIAWGLLVYLATQITSPSLILVLAESRHFAEGAVSFPAAGAVIGFSLAARHSLRGWQLVALLGALAAGLQLANGLDDFVVDGVTGPIGPAAFCALLAWIAAASFSLAGEQRLRWHERRRSTPQTHQPRSPILTHARPDSTGQIASDA